MLQNAASIWDNDISMNYVVMKKHNHIDDTTLSPLFQTLKQTMAIVSFFGVLVCNLYWMTTSPQMSTHYTRSVKYPHGI